MINRKGYSLVMWTAVFAVVTVAAAIFLVSIKRTITAKTLQTTDYLLWSMWGNPVKSEGGWNYQQIDTASNTVTTKHHVDSRILEHKGKVRAIINATAKTTSEASSWQ